MSFSCNRFTNAFCIRALAYRGRPPGAAIPGETEIRTYATEERAASAALVDMRNGLDQWRFAWALAVEDIRLRYMRSFLGIGWVVVSFALFVGVKVAIFLPLSNDDLSFFAPYVALGFFAWTFINSSIIDGCAVFIGAASWIKGSRTPKTVFILQSIIRNLFLTASNFVVVLVVLAVSGVRLTPAALFAIPVFALFVVNALWIHMLFGSLGARYRDIVHLVQTIMRVMFFLTPVFWLPEQMGRMMKILIFNPLTHYILLFRDPVIYGKVPMTSLWVVLVLTIIGSALALAAFAYSRRKIVFWL